MSHRPKSSLNPSRLSAALAALAVSALSAAFVPASRAGTPPATPTTLLPISRPAHIPLDPHDILGVKNFCQVSPILFRGAQPTAMGFIELKRRGIKTIVSLRTFHGDSDMLEGTGLKYIRINCQAWSPENSDMAEFLKVLQDPANQPVFVHCMQGSDRTGTAVAYYRMLIQDWTPQEAIEEIHHFGFHPVWGEVVPFLQRFDPAAIRQRIDKIAPPKLSIL